MKAYAKNRVNNQDVSKGAVNPNTCPFDDEPSHRMSHKNNRCLVIIS